jgi:hypothetical protein
MTYGTAALQKSKPDGASFSAADSNVRGLCLGRPERFKIAGLNQKMGCVMPASHPFVQLAANPKILVETRPSGVCGLLETLLSAD